MRAIIVSIPSEVPIVSLKEVKMKVQNALLFLSAQLLVLAIFTLVLAVVK